MKTRTGIMLLLFTAMLFASTGCGDKECWDKFDECNKHVDEMRKKASDDFSACNRQALDKLKRALDDCFKNFPKDAAARNECIESAGRQCDADLKACDDNYKKAMDDADKAYKECEAALRKCLGK